MPSPPRSLLALTAATMLTGCDGCEKKATGIDAAPAPSEASVVATAAPPTDAGAPLRDAAPDASPRALVPGCGKTSPISFRGTVKRPEGDRTYEARLPAPSSTTPARILFAIHPFGSSAQDFLKATLIAEVFNAAGWVTVAPEGIGKSFNAGDCCGEAARSKLDDVGLMLAIVDDLRERTCVDDARIYLTGFSNGGFMSQAFACAHADRVGAIASVGAVLGVRPCTPSEPVSVLLVNGIGDNVIPPDGGGPFNTRPLSETIATWRDAGSCEPSFGDAGMSRSVVGAMCHVEPCREGRTLEACAVPYAHVWMVRSHPAGNAASARQTAREMLEFFDAYGVR